MRGVFIFFVLILTLGTGVQSGAQTHVFHCEVSADVPKLAHLKIKTTPIEIETQVIGKNIYLWINTPKYFAMRVNSIETKKFQGMNLSDEFQLGARTLERETGLESQLVLNRQTGVLDGFHDLIYKKKTVRIIFQGPCDGP
jgi:hypothetical protein